MKVFHVVIRLRHRQSRCELQQIDTQTPDEGSE
jgi:hypothetical protein